MHKSGLKIVENKVIMHIRERMCEIPEEMLESDMFRTVLEYCIEQLEQKNSPMIGIFENSRVTQNGVTNLIKTLVLLEKYECNVVPHIFAGSIPFIQNLQLLSNFIEHLYDYWRHFDRFIVNDSSGDRLDKRPYRTFNETIEQLTHLIRTVYRHIQEHITGSRPSVYRQVPAGAEMAVISLPKKISYTGESYKKLLPVHVIRQMLIYPPLVIQQPENKRTGQFRKIGQNPISLFEINPEEYLCYPARVGKLLILVYFHVKFYELGLSLCNLFELAGDAELVKCN